MDISRSNSPTNAPKVAEFIIDSNMILKFREEETNLAKIMDPHDRKAIKAAANFFIWQALTYVKDGKPKDKVMEKYNAALDLLANAGLEMETPEEWSNINELISTLRAKEDVVEFIKKDSADLRRHIDVLYSNIHNNFEISSAERKELKTEVGLLREAVLSRGTKTTSMPKVLIIVSTVISLLLLVIVLSGILLSQAIIRDEEMLKNDLRREGSLHQPDRTGYGLAGYGQQYNPPRSNGSSQTYTQSTTTTTSMQIDDR